MKKALSKLLPVLCCAAILLCACNSDSGATESVSAPAEEVSSMFAPAFGNGICITAGDMVKEGMTYGEVVSLIGKPQREIGSGSVVFVWEMQGGGELQITFDGSAMKPESMTVRSCKTVG